MDKLTIDDFKKMLRNALMCITERSDEFSKLDAVLGDCLLYTSDAADD